ncbi:MAG: RhuM family protein, partial [Fibrobacter sp.]|nr:RhuM family protein [Fibrobacter sp.]
MKNVGLLPSGEVDGGKNEIIVYQPEGGEFHIEVRVDQDTVWLTQAQMAELFNTDRTSINRHIRNIFQTQELYENSTCAKIAQVRLEGGRSIKRVVPYYNLDMIISVGYRVNSISGTRFRQWANRVLKEHMLRGFSVNQRLVAHENRLENIDSRVIAYSAVWLIVRCHSLDILVA